MLKVSCSENVLIDLYKWFIPQTILMNRITHLCANVSARSFSGQTGSVKRVKITLLCLIISSCNCQVTMANEECERILLYKSFFHSAAIPISHNVADFQCNNTYHAYIELCFLSSLWQQRTKTYTSDVLKCCETCCQSLEFDASVCPGGCRTISKT